MDVANVIAAIVPALGAASLGDLDWTTATELYQWADEAAKRLSHHCAVFTAVTTAAVSDGVAAYATPAGHVDTLYAALDGGGLREASAAELAALDAQWLAASGSPTRYSMDAGPVGTVTLYPAPLASGTLETVFHKFPTPAIAAGASVVNAPLPVEDYFGYAVLAEARRKESDARMEDMAAHCDERVKLYEQIFETYWGAN